MHHRAKIPDEIVVAVILRCEKGESTRSVARAYDLSRDTVRRWVEGTARRFTLPPHLAAKLVRELMKATV